MRNIGKLIVSILACQAVGAMGAVFTAGSVDTWYAGLAKPSFNPPGWVFAPVWTALYLMMAFSAFLVWKEGLRENKAREALLLFILQLVVNSLWSMAFFGLRSAGAGLIVIAVLLFAIIATIIKFKEVSVLAAVLLLPYLLWVSFAAVLNAVIFRLNS